MTNINITIPDELHKQLKIEAVTKGTPIKELITHKLELYIQRGKKR